MKPSSKRHFLTTSITGLVVLCGENALAQTVPAVAPAYAPLIRVRLARPLPLDKNIFVSGSFNNWGLGDKAWPMTMLPDGSHAARLPIWVRRNYEFKFHLGGWDSEATTARGNKMGNLNFSFSPRHTNYETTIEGWLGVTAWPKPDSTAPLGVSILSDNMDMPQFNRKRRIWVYLPQDYGKANKRYPVIYMQDGQNVFDKATSFAGEWGVDETLNRLAGAGDYGAIVIAINNGERTRNQEYHALDPDNGRTGQADAYLAFIVSTLKPLVDRAFQTKPDRLNTAIAGASSGGTISLYAALKYPDVFGKAALFSTPLWLAPRFDMMVATSNSYRAGTKLWFMCGANERTGNDAAGTYARDVPAMMAALTTAGFSPTTQIKSTIDPEGQHNEQFWGRNFEDAYKWMFGSL